MNDKNSAIILFGLWVAILIIYLYIGYDFAYSKGYGDALDWAIAVIERKANVR